MSKEIKTDLAKILGNSTPSMWSKASNKGQWRSIVELYTAGDYKKLENALQNYCEHNGMSNSFSSSNKIKTITLQGLTALFEKLLNDKSTPQEQWNKILEKLVNVYTIEGITQNTMMSNFIHSVPISAENSRAYMSIIAYTLGEKGERKETVELVKKLIDKAPDIETMYGIIESVSNDHFAAWEFIWKKNETFGGFGGYKWKGQEVSTTWASMIRQIQDKTLDLFIAKHQGVPSRNPIISLRCGEDQISNFVRERTDKIGFFSSSSSLDGSAFERREIRIKAEFQELSKYILG